MTGMKQSPALSATAPRRLSPSLALTASLTVLLGTALWVAYQQPTTLPDFAAYQNTGDKKQAFFSYLVPKIETANARILRDRRALLKLRQTLSNSSPLPWFARVQLNNIAARYHIKPDGATSDASLLERALSRANIVPTPLVLIQAAKESGWGTSKFARRGNNLFGQQCFTAGCGFVPAARSAGRRHEVASFKTADAAVVAYLNNLNTHPRYGELRRIRASLDAAGQPLTGRALADGLLAYSERGQAYVDEVKAMIRQNDLE